MESIRHVALGCCVISTIAGMVRVFWPRNGFTAVINAVLVLYIITAGLQMIRGADWEDLARELRRMSAAAEPAPPDYSDYSRALGLQASGAAVQEALKNAGIEAVVQMEEGLCRVELIRESDRTRAEAVLAAICGQLPYQITAGGDAP